MKAMRTFILLLVLPGCMTGFVRAEFRPWTDTKGNSIEAEYVRTAEEAAVLRKRDGAEIKVPLASLCEEDRTYAMLQCPPRIDIKVDVKLDRETLGYTGGRGGSGRVQMQSVKTEVSLRKTSSEKYDPELSVEVFLIGRMEQMNRYVIIEKAVSKFSFTDENKGLCTYTCGPVDLRNVTGNRRAGAEYEGYLLVVRDSRKEIIAVKASRLEYEKNADVILGARKGAVFDEDFDLIRTGRDPRPRPEPGAAGFPGE